MRVIANADGAARGNPGPAAYGAVVYATDGTVLRSVGERVGHTTNNVAEYKGAIAALRVALELGATEVDLRLDSELIVRQVEGRYRVRNPGLQPLYAELQELIGQLAMFEIRHVPRAENADADALANAALDACS